MLPPMLQWQTTAFTDPAKLIYVVNKTTLWGGKWKCWLNIVALIWAFHWLFDSNDSRHAMQSVSTICCPVTWCKRRRDDVIITVKLQWVRHITVPSFKPKPPPYPMLSLSLLKVLTRWKKSWQFALEFDVNSSWISNILDVCHIFLMY